MASQQALDNVLKRIKEEKITLIKFQWLGDDRFLKHAKQFDDVWFARRLDIAEWWLDRHK